MKPILSGARRGWTPTSDDAQRVERRLQAALAAGVPGVTPAVPRPSGWIGRVLVTAAFTAAGAGAGYRAGRRAQPRMVQPAPAIAAPSVVAPSAPPPPSPQAPLPVIGAPELPHRAQPARRRVPETVPATTAESLGVELRALRSVERALRDHNPGLAAAFLDDLDRTVPGGQMREERSALRAIARCNAGQHPFGVNLADEFTGAYPASAYRARVEQACGTDATPTGD